MRVSLFCALLVILYLKVDEVHARQEPSSPGKNEVSFEIYCDRSVLKSDTFRVVVFDRPFDTRVIPVQWDSIVKSTSKKKNVYSLRLNKINRPVYISLFNDFTDKRVPNYILHLYLVEPGDNVRIEIIKDTSFKGATIFRGVYYLPNYRLGFSGVGSEKYQCRYSTDMQLSTLSGLKKRVNDKDYLLSDYFNKYYAIYERGIKRYKGVISPEIYNILNVDFFSFIELERLFWISIYYGHKFQDRMLLREVSRGHQVIICEKQRLLIDKAKVFSAKYAEFVVEKELMGIKLRGRQQASDEEVDSVFKRFKHNSSVELRDRLLTFLSIKAANSKYGAPLLDSALALAKTDYCIRELETVSSQSSIGRYAYDFSMPDSSGKEVKLSHFLGKVVFLDFWFVGCAACVSYYKNTILPLEKQLANDTNIVFLSINVDTQRQKWIGGVNSNMYTSSKSINLYTNGMGVNHPVISRYGVVGYPKPMLIDKKGRILSSSYEEMQSQDNSKLIEIIRKAMTDTAEAL